MVAGLCLSAHSGLVSSCRCSLLCHLALLTHIPACSASLNTDGTLASQTLTALAERTHEVAGQTDAIEGSSLYSTDGWFYLFTSWDHCCVGVDSNYNIRVGRARDITGPYVDQEGTRLLDAGGTQILATHDDVRPHMRSQRLRVLTSPRRRFMGLADRLSSMMTMGLSLFTVSAPLAGVTLFRADLWLRLLSARGIVPWFEQIGLFERMAGGRLRGAHICQRIS